MDFPQVVLIVVMLVGIVLVVVSLIMFRGEGRGNAFGYFEAGNTIKAIEASIDEMDRTMNEFDSMSNSVFTGIDEKYQELLFLYTLIDEKKNELLLMYGNMQSDVIEKSTQGKMEYESAISNPKYRYVDDLVSQGLSVSDIAKRLDMGQGEVKLILELGKAR